MEKKETSLLSIRDLIYGFIDERLQNKLKKSDVKRETLLEEYQPINWLADAAKRVKQIQLVTHAIKFHNPDAKGSSIYLNNISDEPYSFVSTKTIIDLDFDVVGNAAALDVFKFLQSQYQNESILSRARRKDKELYDALPGSSQQKEDWIQAFSNITLPNNQVKTDGFAKQIYFPIKSDQYVLLSPLYPTSLVHKVYLAIQDSRFSEHKKTAREAKKNNLFYEEGYREHVGLAIQNFGGSKPQNISQLNSSRGGKSYLLSSCPPVFRLSTIRIPKNVGSFWKNFSYLVKDLVKMLAKFLLVKKDENNKDIRSYISGEVDKIVDELLIYAANFQELKPGWSLNSQYNLSIVYKKWLDPEINHMSPLLSEDENKDWKESISIDFARWFNRKMQKEKLNFGDDEHKEWKHRLLSRLKDFIDEDE